MNLPTTLLKLAFGPNEAKTINKLFWRYAPKKTRSSGLGMKGGGGQFSVPKRGGRFIGQMDYTAAMNERESKGLLGKLNALAPGQPSKALRRLKGDISSRLTDVPSMPEVPELRVDPGAYETSIRNAANRFGQRTGAPKNTMLQPLSQRQGKMLNTVIQGHELNERSGMLGREPSLITQRMAHTDTDVVLRESNMAHDLGNRRGYKQVKDYLTANAEMGPEQQRLFGDIDPRLGYGEQKLNRSARKHIKRIADRKYIEAMSEPDFTMKDYEGDIYKRKFGSLSESLLKLAGGPPVINLDTPRNRAMLDRQRAQADADAKAKVDWTKLPGYSPGPGIRPAAQVAPTSAPLVQQAANVHREPAAPRTPRPVPPGIRPGQFYGVSPEGKVIPGTDQSEAAYQEHKSKNHEGVWNRLMDAVTAPPTPNYGNATVYQAPFTPAPAPAPAPAAPASSPLQVAATTDARRPAH